MTEPGPQKHTHSAFLMCSQCCLSPHTYFIDWLKKMGFEYNTTSSLLHVWKANKRGIFQQRLEPLTLTNSGGGDGLYWSIVQAVFILSMFQQLSVWTHFLQEQEQLQSPQQRVQCAFFVPSKTSFLKVEHRSASGTGALNYLWIRAIQPSLVLKRSVC